MSNRVRIYLQKPCDNGTKALLIKGFDGYNDSTFSSVKKTVVTRYLPKNHRYYDLPSKHAIRKGADLYLSGMDMQDGRISTWLEFKKRDTEITVDYAYNLEWVLKLLITRHIKFMVERLDVMHTEFESHIKAYLTPMPSISSVMRGTTRPRFWK